MPLFPLLRCVVTGHRPAYVFHGVNFCPRCWQRLTPVDAPETPLPPPMTEAHLEVLIHMGYSLEQIRREYPALRPFLPF